MIEQAVVDKAHLEVITRYVSTILSEENLSYIVPTIEPAEVDKYYVLKLTAKLLGESTSSTDLVRVPADWWSHLLLTLSSKKLFSNLAKFVKYDDIVVKTETTMIDPWFTQAHANAIFTDSETREVEQ